MAAVATRGFVTVSDISSSGQVASKVGGRVDVVKTVEDINLRASLTDATAKDTDNAPWLRDAVFTADKKISENVHAGIGYDLGTKGGFAFATLTSDVNDRPLAVSGTWFQADNTVRVEGTAELDANNKIWGAYTFNSEANSANRTFVNLQERKAFIIDPFAVNVATAAAKYTWKKDEYTVEPAYDFNRQAAYLTASRDYRDLRVTAGYAFKEEVALVELKHRPDNVDLPDVRFFVKSPASANGFGPISAGVILDKTIEL